MKTKYIDHLNHSFIIAVVFFSMTFAIFLDCTKNFYQNQEVNVKKLQQIKICNIHKLPFPIPKKQIECVQYLQIKFEPKRNPRFFLSFGEGKSYCHYKGIFPRPFQVVDISCHKDPSWGPLSVDPCDHADFMAFSTSHSYHSSYMPTWLLLSLYLSIGFRFSWFLFYFVSLLLRSLYLSLYLSIGFYFS